MSGPLSADGLWRWDGSAWQSAGPCAAYPAGPAAERPALAGELKADTVWAKMALHAVPPKYILGSAFASYLILGLSYLQNLPAWLAFGMAIVPWVLIMFVEMEWTYKHFGWFALFGVMAFVQTIHASEHIIEVIQLHIFNVPLAKAQAIFGPLNVEWVHFLGDSGLTLGTLILLTKFPRNRWLYVAAFFQILHQAEHTFLIFTYMIDHSPRGGPGLLASPGGAIFGGVGLNRPDLHLIYNTLFTVPFVLALIYQLRRSYDSALEVAFHGVAADELLANSQRMETFHYVASQTVLAPGDPAERIYVIAEGQAEVSHRGPDGIEYTVATLGRGQYFGEIAALIPGATHTKTVRALSPLTVLAMNAETFRHVMDSSQECRDEMTTLARQHMSIAELSAGLVPAGAGSNSTS